MLKKVFINYSNHLSAKWPERQIEASKEFGDIVDIEFPQVPPSADESDIESLAVEQVDKITGVIGDRRATIHIMGEMNLTYSMISILRSKGIPCVASTTERIVEEPEPGRKNVIFNFVRFRRYF